MDWAQILVIILSAFLALFLLLGVVLLVLLIRLTQQIRMITATAQRTASGLEKALSQISRLGTSSFVMKTLFKQAQRMKRKSKKES